VRDRAGFRVEPVVAHRLPLRPDRPAPHPGTGLPVVLGKGDPFEGRGVGRAALGAMPQRGEVGLPVCSLIGDRLAVPNPILISRLHPTASARAVYASGRPP
jgi:hypothetical protein